MICLSLKKESRSDTFHSEFRSYLPQTNVQSEGAGILARAVQAMNTRTAQIEDAGSIARLVNDAFRPERFFTDADRTNPEKVSALMQKGKFLLVEEAGAL